MCHRPASALALPAPAITAESERAGGEYRCRRIDLLKRVVNM